ncbi:choline transport protein [Rhizodiscina lignyota]|uniref:Choline transport protein n=1 Tax=Rhizodiscina lignyota TaxID=1504668 RepID=A0A9P4I5D4_9PEZI|nr:choline transport protein [Rhizodiscina lignyota]
MSESENGVTASQNENKRSVEEEYEKRRETIASIDHGIALNASGHKDQLKRHFNILHLCGLALTIDNAWIALGGSITISIFNGGPPGILYELLTAGFYYAFIGASIAELASAIPSAGGVYHWASVAGGPRFGRILGFFTGFVNFAGWIFDLASIVQIVSNASVQMYAVFHPDLVIHPWHVFVAFVLITWSACAFVIFCNRFMPTLQHVGTFLVIAGGLVTIIVVAAMPKTHASNAFVWKDFDNQTGWSGGVAFLTGVLNGAFTIGTPDAITHMAEELPRPKRDLPKGIFVQVGLGVLVAFLYGITISYAISDLDAVLSWPGSFPLAAIYNQATGDKGGTFGLLFIVFLSLLVCTISTLLMVSRIWWALARDNATPFPHIFSYVHETLSCPISATLLCGTMSWLFSVLCTGLGAIALGSKTAFQDLAGSFIILSTTSYALAIAPHLLSGRKNIPPGPFWMGKAGFLVNGLTVLFIVFFNIFFCFPYVLPVTVQAMNYNSVILVGVITLTGIWWLAWGLKMYPGPKIATIYGEH